MEGACEAGREETGISTESNSRKDGKAVRKKSYIKDHNRQLSGYGFTDLPAEFIYASLKPPLRLIDYSIKFSVSSYKPHRLLRIAAACCYHIVHVPL